MTAGDGQKERLLYAPPGEAEAAAMLARCAALAAGGRDISVSQAGSPFAFPPAPEGLRRVDSTAGLEATAGPIDIALSHERLSGIAELSRGDLLVRAGGGTPLAEVEEAVRAEGLYFPHFGASLRDDVTLAALLMEGPVPVLAGAYGGLRESILSVRLVTGAGETVHAGSRAVKDVAGYEIIALLLGAGGRYGMITEATLRLLHGPRTIVRAAVSGPDTGLSRIAGEMRMRRFSCAAVIAGPDAARAMAEALGGPVLDENDMLLWIEIHAPVEGVEAAISSEISAAAGAGARVITDAPGFPDLRRALLRHACGEGTDRRRVMHISWDDEGTVSPEPLGWRDLFPPRSHVLVPVGPGGGAGGAACKAGPILHRAGSERRLRADLLEIRSGKVRGARMTGDWSAPEGKEHAADEPLTAIGERIARVFDPAGILRP